MAIVTFIVANKVAILAGLLGISELLALIPSVKANGIFQGIVAFFKKAQVEEKK